MSHHAGCKGIKIGRSRREWGGWRVGRVEEKDKEYIWLTQAGFEVHGRVQLVLLAYEDKNAGTIFICRRVVMTWITADRRLHPPFMFEIPPSAPFVLLQADPLFQKHCQHRFCNKKNKNKKNTFIKRPNQGLYSMITDPVKIRWISRCVSAHEWFQITGHVGLSIFIDPSISLWWLEQSVSHRSEYLVSLEYKSTYYECSLFL